MCYVPTLVGDQFWKIITKNVVNYKIPKFDPYFIFVQEWIAKWVFALLKATNPMAIFNQLRLTNRVNTFSGASFASSAWNVSSLLFFARHNLKIKYLQIAVCFVQPLNKHLVNKNIQLTSEHMKSPIIREVQNKTMNGQYTPTSETLKLKSDKQTSNFGKHA